MARETKAQREVRLEQETLEREAARSRLYLPQLMNALEQATQHNNYELEVRDSQFELRDRDSGSWDSTLRLTPMYTRESWDVLESLEWDLQRKEKERAETQRKQAVKAAALAKLTKEERELLDLE